MLEFVCATDVLRFLGVFKMAIAAVFRITFGRALHFVDFAEGGGDVCAFEADFVVCLAVDIAD